MDKEETKLTIYLKMERNGKTTVHVCQFVVFIYSNFLAIDGRTNPLSPAKYGSSKIVSSLAQMERKTGLVNMVSIWLTRHFTPQGCLLRAPPTSIGSAMHTR